MTSTQVEQAVFGSDRFRGMLERLAVESVLGDMSAVAGAASRDFGDPAFDWPFAMLCCSALTGSVTLAAQEAVLRTTQGALVLSSDQGVREAAAVLLERTGNSPSLDLAGRRQLVAREAWLDAPAPLQLDVIRRRLELVITESAGDSFASSAFQRQFWTSAQNAQWISVSAPTSAGKSFVVRRWFEGLVRDRTAFRGVYVVPTRALVEEVSADFRRELPDDIPVLTLPWDDRRGRQEREMYVLTQERLHLLQTALPALRIDLLFVDEAQKLGEGARGVLLQQVIDDAARQNAGLQVIFASPLSENPELLLDGAPSGTTTTSLRSETVTVNQNLLWANQEPRRPTSWSLSVLLDGRETPVGRFELQARPSPESLRLPLVAVALAGGDGGNVVYVNGAADAERTARQIFEAVGPLTDMGSDPEVQALRDLVRTAVHPSYALADVLERGAAFHYGNMPLLIKTEIERLFRNGTLRFLVCTSTLLEGVNLPCRNLFVRGPRKGRGKVMTPADFWNLAGRAGRWGKEFQGNIVCVDTAIARLWPDPPRLRSRRPLTLASAGVLQAPAALLALLDGQPDANSDAGTAEAVLSLLMARVAQGRDLAGVYGLADTPELAALQDRISTTLRGVDLDADLLARHPGISPVRMQRLLEGFRAHPDPQALLVAPPESPDAADTYVRAFALCDEHLASAFGPPGRQWMLAILVISWMRGLPLARLIDERIAYRRRQGAFNTAQVIRSVMEDVEQIARFRAPKHLACYLDILRHHLVETGTHFDETAFIDVTMMLELGVSRPSEVALMSLGLSRTSVVSLAPLLVADDWTAAQCLGWLRTLNLDSLGLPALVVAEIAQMLADRDRPST